MTTRDGFHELQRCFACGADSLRKVGAFHYLPEQGGFVPDAWAGWCRAAAVLVRCVRCGSQGPLRRPSEQLLSAWYTDQSYAAADLTSEGHRRAATRLRDAGVSTLVDVGCGAGTFLDLLGPEIAGFGLEPSVASAQFGRQRGRRIVHPDDDGWSAELPGRVDVITLFDVVEHLADPRLFLAGLINHLNPKGRLAIFTGNAESVFARDWGIRWWYHGWAGHLSCFSATGLGGLLSDLGMQGESLDDLFYMHVPLSLRASVHSLQLRVAHRLGFLRMLDKARTPLATSPLGLDHMLAIVRRP